MSQSDRQIEGSERQKLRERARDEARERASGRVSHLYADYVGTGGHDERGFREELGRCTPRFTQHAPGRCDAAQPTPQTRHLRTMSPCTPPVGCCDWYAPLVEPWLQSSLPSARNISTHPSLRHSSHFSLQLVTHGLSALGHSLLMWQLPTWPVQTPPAPPQSPNRQH